MTTPEPACKTCDRPSPRPDVVAGVCADCRAEIPQLDFERVPEPVQRGRASAERWARHVDEVDVRHVEVADGQLKRTGWVDVEPPNDKEAE